MSEEEPPRRRTITPAPNPDRPRLTDDLEERLRPTEEKTAAAYTSIEEGMARIDALLDDGAVDGPLEATETTMHRIAKAMKPPEEPSR